MKLHRSKTFEVLHAVLVAFCYHMKLHRSKTLGGYGVPPFVFCYHMKLHRSKTLRGEIMANKNFATI